MWHPHQEKFVFGLFSFLDAIFHISSITALLMMVQNGNIVNDSFFFIGLILGNLVSLAVMARYARWVYPGRSYSKVVIIVVGYEIMPIAAMYLFYLLHLK